MAQFDVHRSPARGRPDVPFVVVIQSAWFDSTPDRLVVPLVLGQGARELRPPPHMPRFVVDGRDLLLDVLQIRPIPKALLGSLADDDSASRIIAAIDEVITRAHS